IAYETVQRADGSLPLLTPMSEVAGRLSVQEGAYYLGKAHGGRGILLSGVPGVPPGNVVIIGAGVVGVNAAKIAVGLGGDVSILDVNVDRLRQVDDIFRGQAVTLVSNAFNIARLAQRADLLVGAVLVTGARAPVLVPESTVKTMKEGSVIVDVAVDQGGCVETMHPTTLAEPIYRVHAVVHYGVANMPALVPRTSTFALTNATLPYALELANKGVVPALRGNLALAKGLNVWQGRIIHPGVAESVGEKAAPLEECLRGGQARERRSDQGAAWPRATGCQRARATVMTRSFEDQIQATRAGSGAWYARAQQAVGGALGHDVRHALPFPTYITRALGAYKWDVDGHRYID